MYKKLSLVFAMLLLVGAEAFACTNFIVGKKASVDGSVICSYNADDYGMFQDLCHYPAAIHKKGGVDRVMLDNFSVPDTKKAVDIINHRLEVESSGGITYDTIRDYAEQGVDFISVGALTHSVKGLDMSFKAC